MAETMLSTTCVMDCPDTCTLEVSVADGKIQKISGGNDHPNTAGYICSKVARFGERVYHHDRLLYPQRCTGRKGEGKFVRITWDEATATVAETLQKIAKQWGAEAILPYHYGGSNGFMSDDFLDDYFFARLGASRLARTLCAAPSTEVAIGMYGKMPGVAFEDYAHAKAIVIWGGNPKVSHIHLVPYLRAARKNGAFIAVVDPQQNFSPQEIDMHLPVYPGADLPVALAMIRHWNRTGLLDQAFLQQHADGVEPLLRAAEAWSFEAAAAVARVSTDDIRTLATVYPERSPAVIRCGWGLERNRNGGQALAAILAMPALLGKFGVRGGGYTMSNSGAAKIDTTAIFGKMPWQTRIINMTQLGEVLTGDLQPPIKSLFVYNCNPAVTAPDQNQVLQGLAREDLFTVVHEQVMTDTAKFADILLPATTFLEHRDLKKAYGSYVVGGVQPVIQARGEAKPNEVVFAMLGRAMGWQDGPFQSDTTTYLRKVAENVKMAHRKPDFKLMQQGKIQRYDFPGETPIQFETAFPYTPDGKIHLTPSALGTDPFRFEKVTRDRFPLALITPANSKMISSTMGEFNYPELLATMHPQDAGARGIASGDIVRVFNDLGEVICRARVSERIRDGVISMPKGAWRKSSQNGQTATALCPSEVNKVGGGACYNDARVEVLKIG